MQPRRIALLLTVAFLSVFLAGIAHAAPTVCQVANGCTGTGTSPSYGQLLVGNGTGGYSLAATSSLGFTTVAGSSTLLSDKNTFSGTNAFSTSTSIYQLSITNPGQAFFPSLSFGGSAGLYLGGTNTLGFSGGNTGMQYNGGELFPVTDLTTSLGSRNRRWTGIYTNTLQIGSDAELTENNDSYLTFQSATSTGTDSELQVFAPTTTPYEADIEDIVPDPGGGYLLGRLGQPQSTK